MVYFRAARGGHCPSILGLLVVIRLAVFQMMAPTVLFAECSAMVEPLVNIWENILPILLSKNGSMVDISDFFSVFDKWHPVCEVHEILEVLSHEFAVLTHWNPTPPLSAAMVPHYFGVWLAMKMNKSHGDAVRLLLKILVNQGCVSYTLESALHGAVWQTMVFESSDLLSLASSGCKLCNELAFSGFSFDKFEYAALHHCLHGIGHGAFYGTLSLAGYNVSGSTQAMWQAIYINSTLMENMEEVCNILKHEGLVERCLSGLRHALNQFSTDRFITHRKGARHVLQHSMHPTLKAGPTSGLPVRVPTSRTMYVEFLYAATSFPVNQKYGFVTDAVDYDLVRPFMRDYLGLHSRLASNITTSIIMPPIICSMFCNFLDTFAFAYVTI